MRHRHRVVRVVAHPDAMLRREVRHVIEAVVSDLTVRIVFQHAPEPVPHRSFLACTAPVRPIRLRLVPEGHYKGSICAWREPDARHMPSVRLRLDVESDAA